jgi:creatinine amidohydrolase
MSRGSNSPLPDGPLRRVVDRIDHDSDGGYSVIVHGNVHGQPISLLGPCQRSVTTEEGAPRDSQIVGRKTAVQIMERPWVDFDALRRQTDLAIVPTGAVEVYGPHLPTGTDSIVVTHIARRVGDALGSVVLPTVPVGFSRSLGDFPGTLNVSTVTLAAYVREMAESVIGWDMKRLLFLNSHRGNIGPIGEVAMALQDRHDVRCAQVFWWDYVAALVTDLVDSGPHANGHAAEIGTSIMLYLEPQLVLKDRIADQSPKVGTRYPDIIQFAGFRTQTPNGVIGNPSAASAEKGEEMVARAVERIVGFVRDEFGG